ncbi:unnamed protein product [Rotaria sp. Silwood1]|nr:unnamed protein product [Rotaria sp. Silwood1]CAF4625279.1 unnamed protein product [Rotaria sp. Silwood1]CAF4675455.1 unnamed protein product [Rotaria sp. Silwood1]
MLIVAQCGDLPKWPFVKEYTNSMIGSHADILLRDLIIKYEHDIHLNTIQVVKALRKVANQVQAHDSCFDPPTYIKYQYVPYEMDHRSASLTVSYAYDDWTISNVMYAAGLIDEAQEYHNRSRRASGNRVDFRVDVVIGYDGCHSAVRTAMMKIDAINVAQEYFETYYMEFCIPPKNDQFVMEPNYLHIWPRHQFMLIALPNQDKSFTTTLFSPISIFRTLETADDVLTFFRQYFPDAVSFIGANEIIETYFSSKPQPLISTKCEPHTTYNGDMLLMGDAAHSMAPFYAQGMNSAFEDCLVLFDKLKENNFDFPKAFSAYNRPLRIHKQISIEYLDSNEMINYFDDIST